MNTQTRDNEASAATDCSTASRDKVRTHFTWSIEHPRGECPFCGDKTVLLVAPGLWDAVEDSEGMTEERYQEEFYDGVTIHDELTGHYCGKCEKLVSLSLNTLP